VRKGDTHGVTLVEFVGEGENALVAVIPRDTWRYMQESLGGAPAEVLPGKTVTVEGRIYLYKNQPNIEIKSPEHLRVESAH
jgi:DNA/RNA endonuclease YhcR with UshA esterase domain